MTETTAPRRPRRWGLSAPWAIAGLAALAWSAYWVSLSHEAQSRMTAWSDAQAAQSGQPGFSRLSSAGFPFRMQMTATDFAFSANDAGLEARTPRLLIAVNPFSPANVIFTAPEPVRYRLNAGPEKEATATRLYAGARFDGEAMAQVTLEGENVRLANPGAETGGVRFARLVAGLRPDPRNLADWQMSLEIADLQLPTPVRGFERLGANMSQVRAAIVLTKAESLMAQAALSPFEPWRDAGGEARIEALEIAWGEVSARGQGVVRLDFAHRLAGELSVQLANPQAFLGDAGAGAFGPLLARALESLDARFTGRDGVLVWSAKSAFGDLGPYRLRDLDPVYALPEDTPSPATITP